MCFSATASLVAGASLSIVGVATLRRVKRRTAIPFALVPLLFGIQQLIEGLIWLSFRFENPILNQGLTYAYLLCAFVLWPIFIPFAAGSLETVPWRKKVILACQCVGIIIASYLFLPYLLQSATSQIIDHSIVYNHSYAHTQQYIITVMILYGIATVGSCLISSKRLINLFGFLVFLFAVIAYWLYTVSFISVWCFFAAVLSLIVYVFIYSHETTNP